MLSFLQLMEQKAELELVRSKKSDPEIQHWMSIHYSKPKGFVGRQIIYKIYVNGKCYGAIAGGSATLHLPGRKEFFGEYDLNSLVNNTFFHIEKPAEGYPIRNFAQAVVKKWRERIAQDWESHYGSKVMGFETLVEPPRTGELYLRDGWHEAGMTKGMTAKRVGGKGTEKWGGVRVWDKSNLRPKRVFYRRP